MTIINSRYLTQNITGVQRYASEISLELKKLDPSFHFVSPENILQTALSEKLGPEVMGSFTGHLWEQFSLPGYCRKNDNPLVVSFSGIGPLFYKNRIITVHDLAVYRHGEWFSKKYRMLYRALMKPAMVGAQHIITVSQFSRNEIVGITGIPPEKITVAGNAVSGNFSPGSVNRDMLERLGIHGDYILAVGSLDPRKNFIRLARAWEKISCNIDLVIVGGSHSAFSNSSIDIEMKSGRGKIIMPGYLKDEELVQVYRGARLFAYPSLYEGFGIPPLEAMACGTPVVTSKRASMPEVCGSAAFYCDPDDVDSIAGALLMLIKNNSERERLSREGLLQVEKYSWEKSAQKVFQCIKDHEKKQ